MASVAALFRETQALDAFRERVLGLNGDFPFEREDMIELGEDYLERYPECYSNRDCKEVSIGYQLVRICVIEKIIADRPQPEKAVYRALFTSAAQVEQGVSELVAKKGPEPVLKDYHEIAARVDEIKNIIDTIPVGMIKERFIGGISNIFNILYLLKTYIGKSSPRAV